MKSLLQNALLTLLLAGITVSCRTKKEEASVPSVNTMEVSGITDTSATSGGEILEDGNKPVYSKGATWGKTSMPSLESNDGCTESNEISDTFRVELTDLDSNTSYFVRAFARNIEGTAYGPEMSFHTLQKPYFSFTNIMSVTDIAAQLIIKIEFTDCTERGLYFSTSSPPHETGVKKAGKPDSFSELTELQGLNPSTTYYVEAYAVTKLGTFFGTEVSFLTKPAISGCLGCENGSVADVEGNIYSVVKISDQWWMSENLRTTHYNNGDPIMKAVLSENTTEGTYSWYNNDSASLGMTYGALYNWYTVNDIREVCPSGWHVPFADEMQALTVFLGGELSAGGRMKEENGIHWTEPNLCATNESGFNALPGGSFSGGIFQFLGVGAFFWLSDHFDETNAWNYKLFNDQSRCSAQCCDGTSSSYSIRCIKD